MVPQTRLFVLMLAGVLLVAGSLIAMGISRGALNGYFAAAPAPDPSPTPTPAPSPSTPASSPSQAPAPSPPEPPASVFVRFTGSQPGLISIVTLPGAACRASAQRSDGSQYDISELRQPRGADGDGRLTWTYSTTGVTTGSHVVTCNADGKSDTATALIGTS